MFLFRILKITVDEQNDVFNHRFPKINCTEKGVTIMSQESVQQFFQMVSQDQELQSRLKATNDREAYIRSCVELGKEKGYSFTSLQVATALDAAAKKVAENGEQASALSQEELSAVAGGGGTHPHPTTTRATCPNVTKTRGCGK